MLASMSCSLQAFPQPVSGVLLPSKISSRFCPTLGIVDELDTHVISKIGRLGSKHLWQVRTADAPPGGVRTPAHLV